MAQKYPESDKVRGMVGSAKDETKWALPLLRNKWEPANNEDILHGDIKLVYKWINRRSQKKSFNVTQFKQLLKYNPLPEPKIYHLYPKLA